MRTELERATNTAVGPPAAARATEPSTHRPQTSLVGADSGDAAAGTTAPGRGELYDALRLLLADSSDGIVVLDRQGAIDFVSPSLCRLLGIDEDQFLGRPGSTLIEPDDAWRIGAPTRGTGVVRCAPVEVRLRSSTPGSSPPFQLTESDYRDDRGLDSVVWTLSYLSERRSALMAMSMNQEREEVLAAGSSDVTLVCDALGLITYAGPSLGPVFGYRAEHVVGHRWADYIHPDDVDELLTLGIEVLEVEASSSWNFRLRHVDGSWRWVAARFRDLTGHPAVGGTVVNIRDVTESYLADEAAKTTASLYRSIVETAEECITVHDLQGNLTFATPKMATLLGSTVDVNEGHLRE